MLEGRRPRLSAVWIIPLVAALAAGGVALQRVRSEGPTITVLFRSAQGIQPGKTFVKYKDVRIGTVTAVQLSADHDAVEVSAKILKSAAGLMLADTRFWVVRPRLGLNEVSGLSTLLSGNYIALEAGRSGEEQSRFVGLDGPPATGEGGEFLLKARDAAGLGSGAPVYFRRVEVGEVISSDLAPEGDSVLVKVFIRRPYDRFVQRGTRFWNAGGVNLSLGTSGLNVRTASLAAILAGGVEFDTPEAEAGVEPAAAGSAFALYRDEDEARKKAPVGGRRYVLHFDESLHGLSVGAPVTFLGLAAGEVTDVGLIYDPVRKVARPRVEIMLLAERIVERLPSAQTDSFAGRQHGAARNAIFKRMVEERGLRAQLRAQSLIGGQQYVALEYFPRTPRTRVDWSRSMPELPSIRSPLPDLEEKVAKLLDKLERIPTDAIAADLRQALAGLNGTLAQASGLMTDTEAKVLPRLAATLDDASRLIDRVDRNLVDADAPAQQQLAETLQEVSRAARSLRTLADSLERHPQSLLFGRSQGE